MSNSLIKYPTYEAAAAHIVVPGVPAQPALPARTVSEVRKVCGMTYSAPGHYVYTTDPVTNTVTRTFIPDNVADIASVAPVYACATQAVPVEYPARAATPAVPPVYASDYVPNSNLGFNAGARSLSFITANGYAEFKVRASVVGVIVGLNCYDGIDAKYSGRTTDYAFYCARGIAFICENGAIVGGAVGTYTDATLFRVSRTSTTITYTLNGSTVKTTTSALTTSAWLEAALFSAWDEVFDPTLVQVSAADTSTKGGDLAMNLPPIEMLLADKPYGGLDLELPPVGIGFDTGLLVPDYAVMDMTLPPMDFIGTGLTGEIGQMAVALPPLEMLFADHAYGALNIVLPPVDIFLDGTEGPYRASMGSIAAGYGDVAAIKLLLVTMTASGTVASLLTASARIPAEMRSGAAFAAAYALASVQSVVMRSVAIATALTGVPAGEMQTWVINMEGFGSTTYSAYDFNSFARIGDQFYGAKAGGIFRLDGDDDEGEPIRAVLGLGKRDFGTSAKKTVSECFMGVSAKGNLFVKIFAEGAEFLYKTTAYSDEMQQQRVKFGKGLKTNYVTLEVYNEDGADFELDTVEFMVADLSRKL